MASPLRKDAQKPLSVQETKAERTTAEAKKLIAERAEATAEKSLRLRERRLAAEAKTKIN